MWTVGDVMDAIVVIATAWMTADSLKRTRAIHSIESVIVATPITLDIAGQASAAVIVSSWSV